MLSLICYVASQSDLQGYNPQTVRCQRGEHYSIMHTRELNKHYVYYFSLSKKAKRSLATSLSMTVQGLRRWMHRKMKNERDSERIEQQFQTLHKQGHGISVPGMYSI